MGQGASQPDHREESSRPVRRASVFRRSIHGLPTEEGQQDGLLGGQQSRERPPTRLRNRTGSVQRLSQLLHIDVPSPASQSDSPPEPSRRTQMLQRTRSTLRDLISRGESARMRSRQISMPAQGGFLHHRTSYVRSGMNSEGNDFYPPRLPSIELTSSFDHEPFNSSEQDPAPSLPGSIHRSNLRLNSLRPDRPFRRFASLRRRRSPPPSMRRLGGAEDQAAMLSRLLSVAAAATAATLMGDDHNALSEARSLTGGAGVGNVGSNEEDGSFDGFLRALQNGRIASTLRGGNEREGPSSESGQQAPLNFFRMFRFGASGGAETVRTEPHGSEPASGSADGRMVPIIIVGIRSISPSSGASPSGGVENDLPPFIDALGNFPSPVSTNALGTQTQESIDSILRPPQNSTSFRHRRRASMGGLGMGRSSRLNDRMDDQRDHRSPDRRRDRPWSIASSNSALEPRPPPATPASPSPELSRIPSRNSTPTPSRPSSFVANSMRELTSDSRRNSVLHRASATSPLSAHTEETASIHSTHSGTNLLSSQDAELLPLNAHRRSDTVPNIHYPRFASGHPRRNGVVEPDNLPPLSRSSTSNGTDSSNSDQRNSTNDSRSWIIYVLGGSYPENHPILTTPSLFTENPTYEDMMLLSALLGPAKAPVASEEDVQSSGGIYTVELSSSGGDGSSNLVVVAMEEHSEEPFPIEADQRCLVCLCDFEVKEVCRKLAKCQHLFHKECIDQWLTQGRNSCPLCRGQGVDEKEHPSTTGTPDSEGESSSPEGNIAEAVANRAVEAAADTATAPLPPSQQEAVFLEATLDPRPPGYTLRGFA